MGFIEILMSSALLESLFRFNPTWRSIYYLMLDDEEITASRDNTLSKILQRLYGEYYQDHNKGTSAPMTSAALEHLNLNTGKSITMEQELAAVRNILRTFLQGYMRNLPDFIPADIKERGIEGANEVVKLRELPKTDYIQWLIIAACILVGAYFCTKYVLENKDPIKQNQQPKQAPVPRKIIPADLHLIVPASVVNRYPQFLSIDEVKELIDHASHFKGVEHSSSDTLENTLEVDNNRAPDDSQNEFYLRISISDGEKIIGAQSRFALKSSLEKSSDYKVVRKACLKSLSGLKTFVRI